MMDSPSLTPTTLLDTVADDIEGPVYASNDAQEQEPPDASPEAIPEADPATEVPPAKKPAEDAHLPFARVQRIIKADKKISIVAKDATQLIAFATEEFIKRFIQTAHRKAIGSTIQYRDLTSAVREDEFRFLEEFVEWLPLVLEQERELQQQKIKKPKPKKKTGDQDKTDDATSTDGHTANDPSESNEVPALPVIHNSDGTMTYADGGDSEEEMS